MSRPGRGKSAFSLIELLIAIVFLMIAFFGYVALHARILHSGQRLEEKEKIRSATDFYSAMLVSRAMLGINAGPDGKAFQVVATVPRMVRLDTSKPLHISWLTENMKYPKQYAEGMDQPMQLSPEVMNAPYTYKWDKR